MTNPRRAKMTRLARDDDRLSRLVMQPAAEVLRARVGKRRENALDAYARGQLSSDTNDFTTERSLMNCSNATAGNHDRVLEALAAELTQAAYAVALRHDPTGSWVDLELNL